MRELVDTGYLHNHARMWFASIWIHTLELPWQLGADFFLGPGALAAELQIGWAKLDGFAMRDTSSGGYALNVGYRFIL